MARSLSMTRGYFALRMAGMSCTHCLKSSLCVFANLRSWIKNIAGMNTRSGNVMILWIYRMLFHWSCTGHHGKCGTAVIVCGEDSGAASGCVALVLAHPAWMLPPSCILDISHSQSEISSIIVREQAMINPNYQTWLFRDCSVPCVLYFSRRNRSIPFRSVPFRILVTT